MCINTGSFITATALLAAILLVWAQLWVNTYKLYKSRAKEYNYSGKQRENIESIANWWLAWVYLAICFSLAALVCFVYVNFVAYLTWVKNLGIGFFGASLVMALVLVLQSFFSAICKFWRGKAFDKPYSLLDKCLARWLIVVVPAGILGFSLGATLCNNRYLWIGNLVSLLLLLFLKKKRPKCYLCTWVKGMRTWLRGRCCKKQR